MRKTRCKANKHFLKALQLLLLLGLSFFIIYKIAGDTDLRALPARLKSTQLRWIYLAVIINVLCFFVRSLRWRLMLHATHLSVSRLLCFHAVIIGAFVNLFSPKVGDLFRCLSLQRMKKCSLSFLVGTVVAERLVDVVCLFTLCSFILFFHYEVFLSAYKTHWHGLLENADAYAYTAIAVVLAGMLMVYLLRKRNIRRFFGRRVLHFLRGLSHGFLSLTKVRSPWRYLLLTMLLWTLYYFSIYVALLAIDETATLGFEGALVTLAMSGIGSVIPLPASLGSYHALVMFGLISYGIVHEVAFFLALLMHSFNVLSVLVVGTFSLIFFFWYLSKRSPLPAS